MDHERFREFLDTLSISQNGFAKKIHYHDGTVRSWARGRTSIPPDVSQWIEKTLAYLEKNPLPVKKEKQDMM